MKKNQKGEKLTIWFIIMLTCGVSAGNILANEEAAGHILLATQHNNEIIHASFSLKAGHVLNSQQSVSTYTANDKEREAVSTPTESTDNNEYKQANMRALTHAFRNLAEKDFETALHIFATPECINKWDTEMGRLLESSLDSMAFFHHSYKLIYPVGDVYHLAFYNVWIDSLLILSIEEKNRKLRISDFITLSILDQNGDDDYWTFPGESNLETIEAVIRNRISVAVTTFRRTIGAESGSSGRHPEDPLQMSMILTKRIKNYLAIIRGRIGHDAPAEEQSLKIAIGRLLTDIKIKSESGTPEKIRPVLLSVIEEPAEWRTQLEPVFLAVTGNRRVIFFSSPQLPTGILLTVFNLEYSGNLLEDLKVIDLNRKMGDGQ